jgi:hypothetical protein
MAGSVRLDLQQYMQTGCLCGGTEFMVHMGFENFAPSWWGLVAECVLCENPALVPCPVDRPTGPNEDGF